MSLTDLHCANLLQAQYDGVAGTFDDVRHINGVDVAYKKYSDCTAVAFEGSHDVQDWLSNFQACMIRVGNIGGVELGFYTGIPEVLTALLPEIDKDKPVYVIGHSRGAAHAHIFARALIAAGFAPPIVKRVVFGSPNPGDNILAGGLTDSPVRSYRNYRNLLEQDYVCIVPEPVPVLAPYMHPGERILIDMPAMKNDPWLFLARHHLYLYTTWLSQYGE